MKKITLLTLLLVAFQVNSQVISQDFNSALSWTVNKLSGSSTNAGWTRVTSGTNPSCSPYEGAGMAKFASYDIAAGNVYALTSPSFNLVGINTYKVKFNMYRDNAYSTDADKIDVHITTSATTTPSASTLVGTVHRSRSLSPTVSTDGWYVYQFNLPAATNGTRYLRLVATSQYGTNIYIDNVSVEQLAQNDLGLETVNIAPIVLGGTPQSISGSFRNNGSNTVNSATLNWQVDSGTIYTQNLIGLNLAAGSTYNFTHNDQWTPAPGNYSLKVWLTNPNGTADNNTGDNEIIKSVKAASNSTTRNPLLEKFTSSTCGPCASYNGSVFNPFFNPNSNNINLINYQVNWPGSGDPYYTLETGTRRVYYGITAAPTLLIDSKASASGSTFALQNEVNTQATSPAFFNLSATKNLVGSNMTVTINTTPYLTGEYRLFAVVVEKTTTGNVATNGETSFKNVMMKMMPGATGEILNCTSDTPISTTLTADLSGTFVEQLSDLEVFVFVQDYTTKEIMNSLKATDALSNTSFNSTKVRVYPNPSNGLFSVDTNIATDVSVIDITGKEVFKTTNVTNQAPLNLTSLEKGIYMLMLKGENGVQTEKIIIK